MVERILIPPGPAIILVGVLTVTAGVPSNAFVNNTKTKAKAGGVIMPGAIPIVSCSDRQSMMAAAALAVVLMVLYHLFFIRR